MSLCAGFRSEVRGERITSRLSRRKSRQLLALLALHHAGVSRERLIRLALPADTFLGARARRGISWGNRDS